MNPVPAVSEVESACVPYPSFIVDNLRNSPANPCNLSREAEPDEP